MTSKELVLGRGGRRYALRVFTEHGALIQQYTFSRNTRLQLKQIFDALCSLTISQDPPKRPIGLLRRSPNSGDWELR